MSSASSMTIQDARKLLRQLAGAKNQEELHKLISTNVMWCNGVFFSELETLIDTYKQRGDEASANKMRELGDHMARLRFMI